jgi:predicted MFS family arabinose efflux permease
VKTKSVESFLSKLIRSAGMAALGFAAAAIPFHLLLGRQLVDAPEDIRDQGWPIRLMQVLFAKYVLRWIDVEGLENLSQGSYLLAANHAYKSGVDGFILATCWLPAPAACPVLSSPRTIEPGLFAPNAGCSTITDYAAGGRPDHEPPSGDLGHNRRLPSRERPTCCPHIPGGPRDCRFCSATSRLEYRRMVTAMKSGCPVVIVALVATGWIRVWMIIILYLIVGITDALSSPAFSSLIPSIVNSNDLKPALALNSIQFNLSRVMGPAIAGLVMMKFGSLWCFGANAASYIPFFLSIYWLRPPARLPAREASDLQSLSSAIDGIKGVIRSQRTGWTLLSILCTGLFCGPLITLSPLIVKDVLHADASQFGGVLTAFGIGGMLGPLLILATQRFDSMKTSLSASLVYGLLIAAASQVGAVWQLALLLVGGGFLLTVANTSANALLQSQANNQDRAQTESLYMLAMRGGLSLGNLATGMIISFSSLHFAFVVNGLLAIGVQVFIFHRALRK